MSVSGEFEGGVQANWGCGLMILQSGNAGTLFRRRRKPNFLAVCLVGDGDLTRVVDLNDALWVGENLDTDSGDLMD